MKVLMMDDLVQKVCLYRTGKEGRQRELVLYENNILPNLDG